MEDIIYDYNSPKLETQLAKSLDKDIVEAEVLTVLKHMKNNKSPGSDGYTAEFFKFFWKDIKYFVVRAIIIVFLSKRSPPSHKDLVLFHVYQKVISLDSF